MRKRLVTIAILLAGAALFGQAPRPVRWTEEQAAAFCHEQRQGNGAAACRLPVDVVVMPPLQDQVAALQERVEKVLAAPILTVRRERKGRQADDDIRPAILALSVTSPNGHLRAEMATHPRGVRPGDLVAALDTRAVLGRACRTHQWIERDGGRFEPLSVSGPGLSVDATQYARRAFPHVRDGIQPDPGGSPPGGDGRH